MTRDEREQLVKNLRNAGISIFALAQKIEDDLIVSADDIQEWADADARYITRSVELASR